jgi:hypothetical protein
MCAVCLCVCVFVSCVLSQRVLSQRVLSRRVLSLCVLSALLLRSASSVLTGSHRPCVWAKQRLCTWAKQRLCTCASLYSRERGKEREGRAEEERENREPTRASERERTERKRERERRERRGDVGWEVDLSTGVTVILRRHELTALRPLLCQYIYKYTQTDTRHGYQTRRGHDSERHTAAHSGTQRHTAAHSGTQRHTAAHSGTQRYTVCLSLSPSHIFSSVSHCAPCPRPPGEANTNTTTHQQPHTCTPIFESDCRSEAESISVFLVRARQG